MRYSGRVKRLLPIWGALLVLAFCLGGVWVFQRGMGTNPFRETASEASAQSAQDRERVFAGCRQLLTAAEERARLAVAKRARGFHDFVAERQYRNAGDNRTAVRAFAEDITSLGSKGSLVWSKVPFTDRNGYQKRVERLFRQHLFTPEELGAELKKAVESALRDLTEIENQLAVDLGTQIAGTSLSADQQARAIGEFHEGVQKIVKAGQWDGAKDLGNFVTAEVASVIGVQVLTRLGVQAGILGTGAATSWATFGASVVIGLIADSIWGWIDDPEGDIERAVFTATSKIGVDGMNAMNAEFARVLSQRALLWETTIREITNRPLAIQR